MAVNLNPGADATLVQAAYAAAMANVPKDLSGTFEAMAENNPDASDKIQKALQESARNVVKEENKRTEMADSFLVISPPINEEGGNINE